MQVGTIEKRQLGFWMLTALVAGNMIGSGVFMLPAALASYGSIGLLSWMLTAIGAMFLALMFARFSQMCPKTGGPYAYCQEAFGDFVGFEIAYNYWIALWAGNAAVAVALVGYLKYFLPTLATDHVLSCLISVCLVWVLTLVNIIGVRCVGIVQLITTILKLIPLIVLAFVGLWVLHPDYLIHHFNVTGHSHLSALTTAATLTFWSFVGVESATVPAGNVISPEKNIPRATITGTVLAAVVYILSAIAVMGTIPLPILALSSSPFADCARVFFGEWGGRLVAIGAIISCLGTLNGWILLQGQVPMAAAKDKLFPSIFAKVDEQGVPLYSLLISGVLITLLLMMNMNASLIDTFTLIILLATLASLIPYFMTSMAQLLLFVRDREKYSQGSLWKPALIAIISGLYSFWIIAGAGEKIVYLGSLLFFSGVPVYVYMKWRRSELCEKN